MTRILQYRTRWMAPAAVLFLLIFSIVRFRYNAAHEPIPPLPNVDFPSYWPNALEQAVCRPLIYIYEIPEHIQVASSIQQGRCHESNYNAEIILHNQLKDPNSIFHKLYVTNDPEEAELFFIPFFGACYLYHCWSQNNWRWDERCDVDSLYVDPLMDFIQQMPYWDRSGGKNHFMFHPMDQTFTYYQHHERFQPAIFLTTVGDKRLKWMHRHRYTRDITIPSATSLLNNAEINLNEYVDEFGHPLANGGKRDIFAIFMGCCADTQVTDEYSNGIRSLFFNHFVNYKGYVITGKASYMDYAATLARAKYGLSPMGWTLDTTRIWEYLAFGVVPVVIADGIIEPFEYDVDWDSFIVRVRRDEVHMLDKILKGIDDETYERKRKNLWDHGRRVGLNMDAWHFIVRDLCRIQNIYRPESLGLGY